MCSKLKEFAIGAKSQAILLATITSTASIIIHAKNAMTWRGLMFVNLI
ncbi:hypothetical protein HC752_06600 [Vibrio sp. S9_S30]|nr:hypothetical protein [Vibrio sp. S9_S30]MBD1556602.1 hypothetical protein [Vibrio sp. S9_S30]